MKLKEIEIVGFKRADRIIKLKFSEEQVSIIYGENGVGKTTLLEIISAIFNKNINTLQAHKVKFIRLKYDYQGEEKELNLEINNEKSLNEIYKLNISTLGIGLERGFKEDRRQFKPEQIMQILKIYNQKKREEVLNEEIQQELTDYILIGLREIKLKSKKINEIELDDKNILLSDRIEIDYIQNKLENTLELEEKDKNKKIKDAVLKIILDLMSGKKDNEKIKEELDSEKKKKILLSYQAESDFETIIKEQLNRDCNITDNEVYNKIFIEISKVIEKSKKRELQILIDEVNKFYTSKKIVIRKNKIFVEIGEEIHSLRELSSGERHLITFLSIIYFGRTKELVIIDEPELSLNLQWQKKLLNSFSKIAPNTQFIVASHSPAIVGTSYDRLVELV